MSRAAELLALVIQALEADDQSDSKETKKVKNPDVGKTQPVGGRVKIAYTTPRFLEKMLNLWHSYSS